MSCIHGGRPITARRFRAPHGAARRSAAAAKPGPGAAICGPPPPPRAATAPTWRRGCGGGRRGVPRGRGRAQGQDAPPPPVPTGRCPFKTSLLPGPRNASAAPPRRAETSGLPGWRGRRPLGELPVPAGRPGGRGWGGPPGQEGAFAATRAPSLLRPAAARPHLANARAGTPGRHAGHGRSSVRGAAPRAPEPVPGPPHRLRVHGGGAPRRQPISAGRRGTASQVLAGGGAGAKTSWGVRRWAAVPGGPELGAEGPALTRALGGVKGAGAAGRGAGGA